MGSANSQRAACRRARARLDAHVSGELEAGAESETRAHLRACRAGRDLRAERLRVKQLVRRAVKRVEAPPHIADAIRALIRQG